MRFAIMFALLLAACGDGGGSDTPKDAAIDAAEQPDAGCFEGTPTTHDQIINACTTAQKIFKNSKPPLLNANGTLPPLPQ